MFMRSIELRAFAVITVCGLAVCWTEAQKI